MAFAAAPLAAEGIVVPSGQPVELMEVIAEEGRAGPVLRYRYLAPEAPRLAYEAREADMAHLCARHALPHAREAEGAPARIIVSLAEAPVPFAELDPEVRQVFEAYRIEDDHCRWEAF